MKISNTKPIETKKMKSEVKPKTEKKTNNDVFLLIVESSSKCPIIEKYLGSNYKCISCLGHLRTIENGLKSIDVANNYEITFSVDSEKKDHIQKMKGIIKTFPKENILLASDHDREGEAIAWHLCQIFDLPVATTKRILFHEITKPALEFAVANPTYIDINMVKSQQARQVLDLLVGFKLSPLLWKRISANKDNALSAGRCQTPALRLIYENDVLCKNGNTSIIHKVSAAFSFLPNHVFDLNHIFSSDIDILGFLQETKNHEHQFKVHPVKLSVSSPPKPFNTSALLQEISNIFHLGAKETMLACQILYQLGHITYMRTDNRRLSPLFIEGASSFIGAKYGAEYIGTPEANNDAINPHEAIRVTNLQMSNIIIESNPIASKIYGIIWLNTIQSCMKEATFNVLPIEVSAPREYIYKKDIKTHKFKGYQIVDDKKVDISGKVESIASLQMKFMSLKNKKVEYEYIQTTIGFSGVNSHYTEASLIDKLENMGIGRPSTFSMLTDIIQTRGYVKRDNIEGVPFECKEYIMRKNEPKPEMVISHKKMGAEHKKLVLEPLGKIAIEFLLVHFEKIFDYGFTKSMEDRLDLVASGKEEWFLVCQDTDREINKLINEIDKLDKKIFDIDDNYSLVFIKNIPVLKHKTEFNADGKPVLKNVKKSVSIDIDKLESGQYVLSDLLEIEHKDLGLYRGSPVFLKSGKYGGYIECADSEGNIIKESVNSLRIPLDKIVLEDVLPLLAHKSASSILRIVTPDISVRKGKFGPYIYYKTKTMTKPKFINMKSFDKGFGNCDAQDIIDFMNTAKK